MAEFRNLPSLGLVSHPYERGSWFWHARKAKDLHRHRRSGFGYALPQMVQHCTHAAISSPADERISGMQSAFLDQYRCHWAPTPVELGFNNSASGRAIRIGLQLHHVGLQENHLKQAVNAF